MSSVDRRRLVPWLVAAALAVLLLLCLLWIWLHGRGSSDVDVGGESSGQSPGQRFEIDGSLSRPMSPGVWLPLDLVLTNTGDAAILVTTLNVTVSEVSAPHADSVHPCTLDDFAVRQAADRLDLSLAAGGRSSLSTLRLPISAWPQVRLLNRSMNQDGCKESTITLEYAGDGRQTP